MTERPSIHDVRMLVELEHVDDVNLHLAAGWILVKPPAEDEFSYVVGWPDDGEPPRPKGPALADLHRELAEDLAARVVEDLEDSGEGDDPELPD